MDLNKLASLTSQELTSLGREYFFSGRHDLALTVLQTALGKDLANGRAAALLAYLLETQENYQAAVEVHEAHKRVRMGRVM